MTLGHRGWRELGASVLIAFALALPLTFMLAHHPQSPDGFELLTTALQGGVLHPSGLPLQGWLDRAFVQLSPATPALGLSALSLASHFLALVFLGLSLLRLGSGIVAQFIGLALYSCYRPVWAMAIQPEKYALVALAIAIFLFAFTRALTKPSGPRGPDFVFLSVAFALAFAQHSANVFLLAGFPPLFWKAFSERVNRKLILGILAGVATAVVICFAAYASLFLQRSAAPWPDWGHLESWSDLWRHVVRADFDNGLVSSGKNEPTVSVTGLGILLKDLAQWGPLNFLVPVGAILLAKQNRAMFVGFAGMIISALAILAIARLPASDPSAAEGYGERYQLILLPLLVPFLALGFDHVASRLRDRHRLRWATNLALICAAAFTVARSFRANAATDNDLIEIYRREVAIELPPGSLFLSTSEIDLFAGIPMPTGLRFPLKNLFGLPWYRLRASPKIDSRVPELLQGFDASNYSYPAFILKAFRSGIPLASTGGDLFVPQEELRPHLEQRGFVWTAESRETNLYSDSIVNAAHRLCDELRAHPISLPVDGLFFTHGILQATALVFRGAGDALQASGHPDRASRAYDVSESLVPGTPASDLVDKCVAFLRSSP